MNLVRIEQRLAAMADPAYAARLARYFKTGPGGYAARDRFLGIRVPTLRVLAREFRALSLSDAEHLLRSRHHEARYLALRILVHQFQQGNDTQRGQIYRLYRRASPGINNWDLVDTSAAPILGAWLAERSKAPLTHLAHSPVLWERRMAIIATLNYIQRGEFGETLRIARILLDDAQDLIHKAVGWMLREVGKRDLQTAEAFLAAHYRGMPRTMLRYAIERYPQERRLAYLKGRI